MYAWKDLALMAPAQLAGVDIAVMNIACADGLPHTEEMDKTLCLEKLDYFARRVGQETERNLPRFHRKRWDYRNSEAYFRTLALITILQRDCGVHYNPLKIPDDAPFDTRDSFIFGLLQGHGGTCATMPVVYIAVARRLGYPLKLVTARGKGADHFFARWDDGKECFNVEASGHGLTCPPDDYYRTGRYENDPELERLGGFMRSQTPREEMASFLALRYHCWKDVGRHRMAVDAMVWASILVPENAFFRDTVRLQLGRWHKEMKARLPPRFPRFQIQQFARRYPPTFPFDVERKILALEATENVLNNPEHDKQWWEPQRKGMSLSCIGSARTGGLPSER